MRRGLLWRTLLILVIVGFCGFRLWPPKEKVKLGLDLKGGMHLVLSADVEKVIENTFLNFSEDIKRALARKRIAVKDIKVDKENFSLKVLVQDPNQLDEAYKTLSDFPTLEVHEVPPDGLEVIYPEKERKALERHIIAQAVDNIRQRVDRFGVAEATVQPRGENRIIVELPGVHERERVRQLIGKTAKLDFHLAKLPDETWNVLKRIDEALNGQLLNYVHKYEMRIYVKPEDVEKVEKLLATPEAQQIAPAGFEFNIGKAEVIEGLGTVRPLYLIEKRPSMGGESIRNAWKQPYGLGYVVSIEFDKEGAVKFEKLTKEHVGEPLAIVLDGVVQSAPIIREAIRRTSTPIIEGDFTEQEAGDLAIMLKAGALPANIVIEEERSVGPSLGADSIRQGIRAAIIGALLVTVFMVVYYGVGGIIADVALALNLVIILGVLAALGATLTLPGIAGIILTIGMAVDANVLIFERTREELRAGKGIAAAIDAGYKRAFITILDANITTLITALILLQFTTGPIKGFATTLSIGILSSMFTAIVVTRVIFDFLIEKVGMKRFVMLQMVRHANIPFVRIRKIAFIGSLAAIVIGMGAFTSRGQDNYGIDFTGGVYMQREFSEPVPIEDIRAALGELGLGESIIQQFDEGRGVIIRSAVQGHDYNELARLIDNKLKEKFGEKYRDPDLHGQTDIVGPKIGEELKKQALKAAFFAILAILIYVSWRFEFRFAVGAVLALLHDALITLGALAVAGRQISLPVVAAILTILGYSLNDTIVVFDRIRENMHLLRREEFSKIVNASINQTLSRTLLTSLTTLLVVVCLFVIGGEVIKDFAFALLVGIVVGTYSSIFVASPLLLAWPQRRRRH